VGILKTFGKKNKLALASTVDIGILNNKIKRSGGFYEDKWSNFLVDVGVNGKFKPRAFTAGLGLNISYLMNKILFSVGNSFTILDAEYLKVSNFQDFLVNTQHLQFSISYAF
jgi:hypothetical protein